MFDKKEWPGTLTKLDAIRLLDKATDQDDPFWSYLTEDFYDEQSDTMPSIFEVFSALGVTEKEYREATKADGVINWPRPIDG